MGKKYNIVPSDGTVCPRCNEVAETRQHPVITEKQLKQPFYYRRWYNCKNENCKTTTFMLEGWKVKNKNAAALEFDARQEYAAQLDFLRNI
jgi:hypothetical protein